tara:strand:+ start:113 stop:1096 length:984 start_codon:yes stop_codon:yes gene_type:complete
MGLFDTGTPETARFESNVGGLTVTSGERAKTHFTVALPCGASKPIPMGRDAKRNDVMAIMGTGRDAVALGYSLKCTTKKTRPTAQNCDLGCNESGKAALVAAQDTALFVVEVWGTEGNWPDGSMGLVTGVNVLGCRFHRVDGLLKGEVPYFMSKAAEKAMHRLPTDARMIESTDGASAWWRAQDSYWRLRVRLDDSTAISGWMEAPAAGELAKSLALTHGHKAPQRNAASHRLDNLSFWKDSGAVKVSGMKSEDAKVLNERLALILAELMDGKFHHSADLAAKYKGARVNVGTLKAQIEGFGWTIENLKVSAARRVTGEHGYRLVRV